MTKYKPSRPKSLTLARSAPHHSEDSLEVHNMNMQAPGASLKPHCVAPGATADQSTAKTTAQHKPKPGSQKVEKPSGSKPGHVSSKEASSQPGKTNNPPPPKPTHDYPVDPFVGSDKVFRLDQQTYAGFLNDKNISMVMFYDASNSFNKTIKDEYSKASQSTDRYNHGYAAVDCIKEEKMCRYEDVKTLPSFKLYSSGRFVNYFVDTKAFKSKDMIRYVETAPEYEEPGRPTKACT